MDFDRFQVLLDHYFDEIIDDEMVVEFEQMLLAHPKARDVFWEQARIQSMLRQLGQESWGETINPEEENLRPTLASPPPLVNNNFEWWAQATPFLLAAIFTFLGGLAYYNRGDQTSQNESENQIESVQQPVESDQLVGSPSTQAGTTDINAENPKWIAVLRRSVDVDWNDPLESLIAGESISQRRLDFDSGMVEIQTSKGVVITLEGPADLEIVSDMEVVCRRGRLRVDVPPPATGFVVSTPQFDVLDLGTSFALDVQENDKSEVFVIKGKVEIISEQGAEKNRRELTEGQAVDCENGVFNDVSAEESKFPSPATLNEILRIGDSLKLASWKRKRDLFCEDPNCIAYFDFQTAGAPGRLINKSINADPEDDGTIVGAQWTQGRWPGKQGLEFRSKFDRVLFSLPGEHQAITCLASIRLDSIDSRSVALVTPRNDRDGSLCWMITPAPEFDGAGSLQVCQNVNGARKNVAASSPTPDICHSRLGTWIQIAFVFDRENRIYQEYVNGKLVTHRALNQQAVSQMELKQMQIGNHQQTPDKMMSTLGNLVGCVDELIVFNRAMPSKEVYIQQSERITSWSNAGADGQWDDPNNWHGTLVPATGDTVFIDHSANDHVVSGSNSAKQLSAIIVGSVPGRSGHLTIDGGSFEAIHHPIRPSRAGVSGGEGHILQQNGIAKFDALQIGLGKKSVGSYRLENGELTIWRAASTKASSGGSIFLGVGGGTGRMEVAGGTLKTRRGIQVGNSVGGVGTFFINGSKPQEISIGSYGDLDGYWFQGPGSTLSVAIDAGGVTPIFVDDVDSEQHESSFGDGDVMFSKNAKIEVQFAGPARSGSWDLMHWEGELIDEGLSFSANVDQEIWSFQFVDTDDSGTPDTLRVSCNPK